MNRKSFSTTASALALAFAAWITPVIVQGQPLYDRINVNLPYKITLGDKVLEPGDYTIQRLPDNGGGRVLLFYSDSGMKFETSAMTIPALDINTARDTKLILGHIGDDYYIEKIWVQGKDYGYELPMPNSLKSREKEQVAKTTVPAETAPPPVTSQTEAPKPAETPQNTEATHPVETPAPPVEATAQPDNTANREAPNPPAETPAPAPTRMPETAANWMLMLLSGGTLSGAGLLLHRRVR